ncbi:MAG: class 1 fructose-bisphosphatase, partial [Flavobacterium sp.]
RAQVAAGYLLYGSSTMLVYTTGHGVVGFTYETSLGEFFLSHPRIRIPATGPVFSCNEGYWFDYPEYVRQFLMACKQRRMSGRYVGSLVADYHRNLFTGGIYLYPPTAKNALGKLRVLYENFPLAFLIEQAGGRAETGQGPMLDLKPVDFHQRSPLFVGSADLVAGLVAAKQALPLG